MRLAVGLAVGPDDNVYVSTQWVRALLVLDPDTGRMLLYGGSNPVSTDQFFSLDLATNTWTQISPAGPAPQSRWGHACIWDSVAHRMVLVGGYTGDNNPAYRAELTQEGGAEVDTWFWRG